MAVLDQDIKGLPAGATVEPIVATNGTIRGLPAGAVVEPLSQPKEKTDLSRVNQPFSAADEKKYTKPVAGLPEGATVENIRPGILDFKHPAQPKVGSIEARTPSLAEKTKNWFLNTDTGKTLSNNFEDIHQMAQNFWTRSGTPLGGDPKDWEKLSSNIDEFVKKNVPAGLYTIGLGGVLKSDAATRAIESGSRFAFKFPLQMSSPQQVALFAATFGESAFANAAAHLGLPELIPAAKTLGKLIQVQFISQMAEGGYVNLRDSLKAALNHDWDDAPELALNGLSDLLMARGGIDHAEATDKVQHDLDQTSREQHGKGFDSLTPEQQGLVIEDTIQNSAEYRDLMNQVDAENDKERQNIINKRQLKAARYAGTAYEQAWNPDASRRAVQVAQEARYERARQEEVNKVAQAIKEHVSKRTAELEAERQAALQEGREKRLPARQEAAEERAKLVQSAADIQKSREETYSQRQTDVPTESETARAVESRIDDQGHVSYPAQFWGEENTFGVGTDGNEHSVYRQTPRGTEWLDQNGEFVETPETLFKSNDPETADTLARLSSLTRTADGLAAQDDATPEQIKEADELNDVRRSLVNGEISASEAQKKAGIAERSTLPDDLSAARDGRLSGPFAEKSANDYQADVESQRRESGASDEEVQATVESLPQIARLQTESNLHHVYQPGDYVVSSKGVKWTLDSKGMLHPDSGEAPIPLMKRGSYSNQAMQIAASGNVGYGSKTRIERKQDFARQRDIKKQIRARQDEFDREMRVAQQNAGLETIPAEGEVHYEGEREERRKSFLGKPLVAEEIRKAREQRRAAYKVSNDPNNVINQLASQYKISPDEVMRIGLSERTPDLEGKIASLEVGDRVSDPFRPDRPWIVEENKGQLSLRSGQANAIPLDRLSPSARVKDLLQRGEITHDRDWNAEEKAKVAFEKAYLVHQRFLADQVKERQNKPAPEPRNEQQAKAESEAAERRSAATESLATAATVEALNPATTDADEADQKAEDANSQVKLAEEGYAQEVKAKSQEVAEERFPSRAPATIGYRGEKGTIVQNNREFTFHFELLPIEGITTSHNWNGIRQVPNEDYPADLQPRTISEDEARQNDLRARSYDFRQYSDRTINGTMGPTIVDEGGYAVGGNTRLEIMKRHLQNLESIGDPEQREAAKMGFSAAMRNLAAEVGISRYPEDGKTYVVVRMLDKPIETTREAAELGRLFNKSVSVQITKSARGVSYSKSFTEPSLEKIGQLTEANGGLVPAMEKDPEFFRDVVINQFGVTPEEYADWFRETDAGLVLNEQGRDQFLKALLGRVIGDTSVLSRIEGRTPYRALERGFGYVLKMKAIPDRDISGKIEEAIQASADTQGVDVAKHSSLDPWKATYAPQQTELLGMESEIPPEPDRMVEALWRALHASDVATPRIFNDRLKVFLGEETAKGSWIFGEHSQTPVEAFNRAFGKELTEVAESRGDKHDELTQTEYDAALRNQPLSDQEIEDSRTAEKAPEPEQKEVAAKTPELKAKGIEPPPRTSSPALIADRKIAAEKAANGYITPQTFKEMLHVFPTTKDNAESIYDVAKTIARVRWERAKPEGVEQKDALGWLLKEIGFRGIEKGSDPKHRGEYDFATGIMRLNDSADKSTFIHEFSHAIAPLITEDEWKQIETIKVNKTAYRREYGKDWEYTGHNERMEKLAYGLEKFLRDENAVDFRSGFELRKVLQNIKEMFVSVYRKMQGDPLSPFKLSEDAREWMADHLGITGFNESDVWRDKVKKARAEEKKIRPPKEEPHPVVTLARELGATGVTDTVEGKVEDTAGDRVDPKKPIAVLKYTSLEDATSVFAGMATEGSKIKGAELIKENDGGWAIKINTPVKIPKGSLFQELPERHDGLKLEDLEKRFASTPTFKTFERRLIQLQIDKLKSKIRADHGIEEIKPQESPELARQVLQEKKNAQSNRVREVTHGVSRIQEPPRTSGIPQPPKLGVSGHAGAGPRRGEAGRSTPRAPISLAEVKPVNLQPLAKERGEPVGPTGEKFDQAAWVAGLKRAGLPEDTPAPTYALDPKTAAQLIYPGQKQIVQTAMSALEQGDGVALVTPAGTGKSKYTGPAIIKEFLRDNPDANVLVISKNRSILKAAKKSAANNFGLDYELDPPTTEKGIYAASFMGMLQNDAYKNTKWDLVLVDEAGEARRWYDEDTKQGQLLRDVVENSRKAVYASATPFHSPSEYGYLDKLNLWPKGQFDKWIQENFAHEKIGDKIVARLDPAKQAKLRQQLIERGQFISQAISYDGYNAHFGVVPVTDSMKRGLDRIREGFARARDQFIRTGKKGLAQKTAAFEAVYTKNFLERERLPQAIDLARKAREQGWRVLIFSEHTADDLFRRERIEGEDPTTYQQLDDAMGGGLSKIIPPYQSIYDQLHAEFGDEIGDYSGRGNTDAAREKARTDFLRGTAPMLYASYAGGGIGVDMHDADYPELGIKGGDKPIVAIYLGPPYSGVLLEQAMGRPWRFGVKSDVHAVFLATDAEPDIRLLNTKVGPRMRALRAAVLGEKDSLANVMAHYTDDEKMRERQDQLAYAEGNEMKLDASKFQVRPKTRQVGVQDWSEINFPSAEEAKNKGMKYGEAVTGGDWSTLYQSKFELRPPDSPEDAKAKQVIDKMGNAAVLGNVEELQNLDPADRKMAAGASSATATSEVDIPVDRDKDNTAKQSMKQNLRDNALIPYQGIMLSQEQGMVNIARLDGKPEVGYNLRRMNRSYRAQWDVGVAQSWNLLEDSFKRNSLKPTDDVVREMSLVLEGKKSTDSPKMQNLVNDVSDMMRIAHGDLSKAGVNVTTGKGAKVAYSEFPEDPKYFPHRIDWEYKLKDEDGKEITVRQLLKIDERRAKAALDRIPELKPYSFQTVMDYLRRNDPRSPKQGHIHFAREVNFPFIKRDYGVLLGYFDQVAQSISAANNFGPEEEKLNDEIKRITNPNGRETLNSMFRASLHPQNWSDITSRVYNAAIAYEAASKMTFSAFKVPYHLVIGPLVMKGRVAPLLKASLRMALHPHEVMENAAYVGTIARQLNASEQLFGERMNSPVRQILRSELFESAYKMVRTIAGESARVYLDQYALRDLKKPGTQAEHTRRMLRDVFLIGDHAIDQAIQNGGFTPEDMAKGQTAFTNQAAFSGSGDPMQMPQMARHETPRIQSIPQTSLNRAIRLTYALQSFSVKALSAVREHLFDEVVVHGNLKPLMYAMIAFPAVGTALNLTGTGAKHVGQMALEKIGGKKHKEDSWDKYIAYLGDTFGHPDAVKFLKWYVDSWALSAGMEMVKTLGDPLFNLATGKPAKADDYWDADMMEHVVGPFWSDVWQSVEEVKNLQKIHEGKTTKRHKELAERRSITKYATGQVPALKELPTIQKWLEPPPR